jgi:hypothetical protein
MNNSTFRVQVMIWFGVTAVLSAIIAWFLSSARAPFYFSISMRSLHSGNAQIFYDLGRGMNEGFSSVARSGPARPSSDIAFLYRPPANPSQSFGNGSEVRDYIYSNDISRLITRVLSSPSQNETFNIGTGG